MGEAKETQTAPEITTLRVYGDVAERFRQKQREVSVALKRDINQSDLVGMALDSLDKHGLLVQS